MPFQFRDSQGIREILSAKDPKSNADQRGAPAVRAQRRNRFSNLLVEAFFQSPDPRDACPERSMQLSPTAVEAVWVEGLRCGFIIELRNGDQAARFQVLFKPSWEAQNMPQPSQSVS
jgi:hypothetical protein